LFVEKVPFWYLFEDREMEKEIRKW
jgi:hypothetical protein